MTLDSFSAIISHMILLHSFRRCPFAIRVRMCLEEKELSFTVIEEDLSEPSAELLKLHPEGKVPLLIDDEQVIYESSIITEYLDEKFPIIPLMPQSPRDRVQVRLWTYWCNEIFKPDVDLFKYEQTGLNDTEKERLAHRLCSHLEKMEVPLKIQPFLIGSDLTLADVHVFPFYRQLQRAKPGFSALSQYPSLISWYDRISSRPSFIRTMAKK